MISIIINMKKLKSLSIISFAFILTLISLLKIFAKAAYKVIKQ